MANFGDINGSITIGAGQAIRRNAGDNAFEAFTPLTASSSNSFGMSNLGNTSGTSGIISGASLGMYFAGGDNVTLSQSINGSSATITISAGGGGTGGGITNINFSAGTTSQNLSKITFADGNGVSFGLNGSVVTATVATNYQSAGAYLTSQSNQAVSAANGSFTFQTLSLADSNGVSWSTGTQGVFATVKTDYQTSGAYLTTAMVSDAESQFVNTSAGLNLTNISATFNSNSISLSVGNYITSQSNQAISAGNGSFTFQTATLADSNGLSFSTGTQGIYASYTVPSTAGLISAINFSAGTTSQNLSKLTFNDSNGVSFGLNGSVVTATVKTDYQSSNANYLTSQSNQALSGSNGSFAFQTATFGNLNGVSFYTSNGSLVASHNGLTTAAQSDHSHGNPTLALTNLSGTTASASNGLTLSLSAAAPGGGAGYSAGMSNIGNTSGTSGTVASQLVFAGGNNITLSQSVNGNSATVTISAGAGGAAGTLTNWEVFPQGNNSTFSSMGQNSFYLQKLNPEANYAFSNFELRMSGSFVSSTNSQVAVHSIKYGLYSLNDSSYSSIATSQLIMSASYNSSSAYGLTISQGAGSYTITSNNTVLASYVTGFKHLYLPFVSTLTAGGKYGFGLIISSATTVNTGPMRVALLNQTIINNLVIGKIHASTILASNTSHVGDYAMGVGNATTGAMPSSIGITALTNQVSQARLYIQLE